MLTSTIPIVALDVATFADAQALVQLLGDHCDYYKVGLELFSAEGPRVVTWLREQNKKVFVDLKLHDIPNTVQSAARSVAKLGASLLTVHASGGTTMMRAAVQGTREGGNSDGSCAVLAVTILTSLDSTAVGQAWGRESVDVKAEVLRLAKLAHESGTAGVVCSGLELIAVHAQFAGAVQTLVPGIRLAGGDAHDQARTITPAAAIRGGAHWLVLGRAVTRAPNPIEVMTAVNKECGRYP